MFPESELELFLRRCRRAGFIEQLGVEVTYYEIPGGGIRIIASDLRVALKSEPPLEFLDCMDELRRGRNHAQVNPADESRRGSALVCLLLKLRRPTSARLITDTSVSMSIRDA